MRRDLQDKFAETADRIEQALALEKKASDDKVDALNVSCWSVPVFAL